MSRNRLSLGLRKLSRQPPIFRSTTFAVTSFWPQDARRGIVLAIVFPGAADVKLVIAIIQPTKLKAVQEALARIGVERMTVCDAQGYGRQRGQIATYRGVEYKTNLLRKVAIEIVVNDDFLERTIETIELVARTGPDGSIGDGKVFVLPVDDAYRIGGLVRGPEAV